MLALAVAYEVQCRSLQPSGDGQGLNHATQLAMSIAAGAGKLFGLSEDELANAISIATVDNVSLACIHVEPYRSGKGSPQV